MSIKFIPEPITSGYNLNKINTNFQKISTLLEDALNRNGVLPNQMNSDFDMNGYNILNTGGLNAESIVINGMTVQEYLEESAGDLIETATEAAASASSSAAEALGYSQTASILVEEAEDLVEQAVSGFIGFTDGLGYDFGSVATSVTYFDQDWGSVA
jgi:hypothetical protein